MIKNTGGAGHVSGWLTDARYGLRLLSKKPAVIGATIGGLALAIAVCTTIFAILNATVLRKYGMTDPATVVKVELLVKDGIADAWPHYAFTDIRGRSTRARVEALIADSVRTSMSSSDPTGTSDRIHAVSGGYFTTLGGRTVRGRPIQPSDESPTAPAVVVLNDRVWRSRFNSDPSMIGKTMWVSGAPYTIVGVADPGFTGPEDNPPALWTALRPRRADMVSVFARVADRAAATHELSAIVTGIPDLGLRTEDGRMLPATGVQFQSAASPLAGRNGSDMMVVVAALLGIVGLVMALACANLANLQLAGATARTREIGMRLALGASRGRILRQLLSESVIIGLIAGAGGLLLSVWLVPIAASAMRVPETQEVRIDVVVFLFAAALAVFSSLAAGLAPARHAARGDLAGVLKASAGAAGAPPKVARLRRWFIGLQAAGSVLLLITAALFVRGALQATRVDLGFDAPKLITIAASFSEQNSAEARNFWMAAQQRVRQIPSVENTALALFPPFGGGVAIRQVGNRAGNYQIFENRTEASYFATVGSPLVRGRAFTDDEVAGRAQVAVISETIVRDFFGGADPIGASLSVVADSLASVRVVGVVAEAVTGPVSDSLGNGAIYYPLGATDIQEPQLIVRAAHPTAIARDLEKVISELNPRVRVRTQVMLDEVDRAAAEPRIVAVMSSGIAGLALVLSVLGLFGVATFVVNQRLWEMQVRLAIGASAGDIVSLLVRQSLTPVVIGLIAGLGLAVLVVPGLAPALSGVSPYDPIAIGAALLLLLAAAVAAVVSPALRAAKANPADVLRSA